MRVFQEKVYGWALACFGGKPIHNKQERTLRFLEEALELVQSCDCSQDDVKQLVDYVYARPIGEMHQEVGGTIGTLAMLCQAHGLSLDECAYKEFNRVSDLKVMARLREKYRAKPSHIKANGVM